MPLLTYRIASAFTVSVAPLTRAVILRASGAAPVPEVALQPHLADPGGIAEVVDSLEGRVRVEKVGRDQAVSRLEARGAARLCRPRSVNRWTCEAGAGSGRGRRVEAMLR